MFRFVVFCSLGVMCLRAAEVGGKVVDARGGEPLGRVRVQLAGTPYVAVTDAAGRFALTGVPEGDYSLNVETVGYRLLKRPFHVTADETLDYEIVLSPDTFRRTDSVEVRADPFDSVVPDSPAQHNLTGSEVKNLGTVLMDDPVRAIHSLPGVVSNDDFYSQFSLRGAGYERIGFYLDDILLHAPFHTVQGINDSASISILNTDMLDSIALLPSAFSSRYADRSASAVDVRTREGSRTKPSYRVSASLASVTGMAEGPLGKGRGSWLVSSRRSYLQHIVNRINDEPTLGVGFLDYQGKLTYDIGRRSTVNLHVIDGTTDIDESGPPSQYGVNTATDMRYHVSIIRSGWRFAATDRFLVDASAAWMREKYDNVNRDRQPLGEGRYGEWVGNVNATWSFTPETPLRFGWSSRRLRDAGATLLYFNNSSRIRLQDGFGGTALRQGGYVEQAWNLKAARFSAGLRWDKHELVEGSVASPHAALNLKLRPSTELQLGWGQYVQFPELMFLTAAWGGSRLLPERANHYVAALEQRIGQQTRVRIEAYTRDDRDLLARPFLDARLAPDTGRFFLSPDTKIYNSVRGYARGLQFVVQRRSANRLTGWVGYTWQYASQRDGVEQLWFPSPHDQRHTVNSYWSYRITPSLNVSTRWSYGSGTPLPGFFRRESADRFFLSALRNRASLGDYQRLDFRANKSFTYERWKLTLYGELLNATNHNNLRITSFDGVDTRTSQAFITVQRVFPILPSGGVMLEF